MGHPKWTIIGKIPSSYSR